MGVVKSEWEAVEMGKVHNNALYFTIERGLKE